MKKFNELPINTKASIITLNIILVVVILFALFAYSPIVAMIVVSFGVLCVSFILLWHSVKMHLELNEKYGKHK